MNSAAEFINSLSQENEDASVLFGNFLDSYYRADIEKRERMLAEEPKVYQNVRVIDYVNIAATVHKLARDSGISVPSWVFKKKYYTEEPYFPVRHPDLRLVYMFESPSEFKHRNMFVSENVLSRV